MSTPPSLKIVTIEIPVSDLPRAIDWYTGTLGLTSTWTDGNAAMLRTAPPGGPTLFLVRTDDPRRLGFTNSATGVAHSVIDFCAPDLRALHAQLTARGIPLPPLADTARGFVITDPDGNRIGLCDIDP